MSFTCMELQDMFLSLDDVFGHKIGSFFQTKRLNERILVASSKLVHPVQPVQTVGRRISNSKIKTFHKQQSVHFNHPPSKLQCFSDTVLGGSNTNILNEH